MLVQQHVHGAAFAGVSGEGELVGRVRFEGNILLLELHIAARFDDVHFRSDLSLVAIRAAGHVGAFAVRMELPGIAAVFEAVILQDVAGDRGTWFRRRRRRGHWRAGGILRAAHGRVVCGDDGITAATLQSALVANLACARGERRIDLHVKDDGHQLKCGQFADINLERLARCEVQGLLLICAASPDSGTSTIRAVSSFSTAAGSSARGGWANGSRTSASTPKAEVLTVGRTGTDGVWQSAAV